ncbi:putative Ig domain-containing protein [Nostoc sp.]|uniref:putative Ig domain-containing protein n=1 Tax=Nostoc sp. TaxID=1180 RepID=UPI002FF65FB2
MITQSFATFANSTLGNGLPDNGLFSATNFHPDIQLSYRNSDNGYNAHLIKTSTGSFTFNVSGQYAYVHLGLTSTEGSSNVHLTLNYSDGTTKTTNSQTIPDWYNEITESKTLYYLINDLDLSNADATGFNNANDPAIFGVRFSANAAKTLQSITVEKTASTGYLVFLGATGELNTAPTLNTPTAINYTDTANDDTFTAQTGTLAASDPDSEQTLTYGIDGGTVNGTTVNKIGTYGTLSLDTSTGAYTFTPVDSAIEALTSNATEGFNVTVSDGTATDNKTLDINLTGVNDAPILQNAIADQIAKQDTTFSFTFDANTFNDVDAGDNLTYSATLQDGSNLPNWLKFNAATRTFSGTPANADVVNLTIEVQAKDNDGVSATDTFALAVEDNNGTPTSKLSKIADDIFKISNSSDKSKLQVTLTGQSSNLVNELGVFTVDDAQGNINGIAPGAAGYAQAALDRAKIIFSAIANLPNGFNTDNLTHLLEFNSDDNFRFYLVKNSTTDAVRTGVTPLTDILFSDPLTQKITDLGNDDFSLAWKDGGNNAADFNNLVVKIQSTNDSLPLGTNLQGNSQGEVIDLRGVTSQVKADFVVNREAAFNNFIGFYKVADENGGIDTNGDGKADILTGQAGYTEAAVRGRVAGIDLTVNNQGSATSTGTFQPGSIFVPFIITNGTPNALLDSNSNNDPAVYFPFLGANTDKVDHIRLLGNNVFGFEDLASGGDKDFNDMIVRVNLTIA